MTDILTRIEDYLTNGGLFNPDQMPGGPARDLILDCRAEINRLRGVIQFIGETGEDMAGELWEVRCDNYRVTDGKPQYIGPWIFIHHRGETFIEAVEAEMRSREKTKQ